ncbi:MAG TPA: VWA domain-containing protein [Polyangia bacterium]|nr:VWA domain-containing protein [Polyangia bacterium]
MAGLGWLSWLFSGGMPGAVVAVVAAVAGAAIVALHFVRLRRREVAVPFAALWLGLTGAGSALRRARRLRHWLALALALAIAAALLLAAVDPRPAAVDRQGRSWVVLIDKSSSMSATDEAGTRLEAARARARQLIAGMGPADRALVASFAADAAAESGFEADPAALDRAVAAVAPTEDAGDLPRALSFAAAVLRGRPRPTVALISDGGFSDDALRNAPPGLDVRYAAVGRRRENVGILALGARRVPADPGAVEAGLTVQSFRAAPVAVPVEIRSGGAVVERMSVALAPGERRALALHDLFAPGARIEARLGAVDDLASDDAATAVVPPVPHRRILRVGDADLYLDGALLSLGAGVSVTRLPAEQADQALAHADQVDLIVCDGVAPARAPSSGNWLYFDPRGDGSPVPVRGRLRAPILDPATIRHEHPLLRHLDLGDVNIAEAGRVAAAPGDVVLAASFGAPLILARERPGLRVGVVAFDPRRSDLPLRPAFPLLIANALAWGAHDHRPAEMTAGAETARDPRESDTAPVARLQLGGQSVPALELPPPRRRGRMGTWAAALALVLLVVEWVSYHRRWTA